ncbi:MAG: hypothetical protein KKB20_21935, partial [Proteobacteria bacterium]|nr:hypothetical protein [Pseudomonadota bacterium]
MPTEHMGFFPCMSKIPRGKAEQQGKLVLVFGFVWAGVLSHAEVIEDHAYVHHELADFLGDLFPALGFDE